MHALVLRDADRVVSPFVLLFRGQIRRNSLLAVGSLLGLFTRISTAELRLKSALMEECERQRKRLQGGSLVQEQLWRSGKRKRRFLWVGMGQSSKDEAIRKAIYECRKRTESTNCSMALLGMQFAVQPRQYHSIPPRANRPFAPDRHRHVAPGKPPSSRLPVPKGQRTTRLPRRKRTRSTSNPFGSRFTQLWRVA